ncbi:hypothetical protein [Stenotrophomonas sp. Marseille-Q4652]|nr:hypothetical protein [Stenotrophomonas sp. Marseille-Q4652]
MNRSKNRRRNANASFLVLLPLAALGGPVLAGAVFLFSGLNFF